MVEAIERMMEVEGRYKVKPDIKRRKDMISCIQWAEDFCQKWKGKIAEEHDTWDATV